MTRRLKKNKTIITTLRDRLSKFIKSSINCKISQESLQTSTCSMTMDDVLQFVKGSVTSGLLNKLSGDNEPNERNSKVVEKSLPDDDIGIIFEKITKEKDKRKRNIKISRKKM